jgi:hypothetical protein
MPYTACEDILKTLKSVSSTHSAAALSSALLHRAAALNGGESHALRQGRARGLVHTQGSLPTKILDGVWICCAQAVPVFWLLLLLLPQAASNAKNNNGAQKSKLYVAEAFADQGPILKRFRCRAQGR